MRLHRWDDIRPELTPEARARVQAEMDAESRRRLESAVTLTTSCRGCGRLVDVSYEPRDEADEQDQMWECPYPDCEHLQRSDVPSEVLRVVARYELPPAT